ncbi:MAG: hypothetical protein WCJ61_10090 [Paludibacter sp.]
MSEPNSEILIYQNPEGSIKIDVKLEEESVWLSQSQLCDLFQKSKATISEHIKNVFEEGELSENSVVRNFRTTTTKLLLTKCIVQKCGLSEFPTTHFEIAKMRIKKILKV